MKFDFQFEEQVGTLKVSSELNPKVVPGPGSPGGSFGAWNPLVSVPEQFAYRLALSAAVCFHRRFRCGRHKNRCIKRFSKWPKYHFLVMSMEQLSKQFKTVIFKIYEG